MGNTLYLLKATSRMEAVCQSCGVVVPRGAVHFRHDPHPSARVHRGEQITRWCRTCILASVDDPEDNLTGRFRIPAAKVRRAERSMDSAISDLPLWQPLQRVLVQITPTLRSQLIATPELIHGLTPDQFEEFICERLYAMGMEPKRVGSINAKDGGVDIVFWPRAPGAFPFLGAAQVKHHRDSTKVEPVSTVRDFAGVMAGHSFNAGIIVTNTTFSPDAKWFAAQHTNLMRLRDFTDLRRWMVANFADPAEWRELPSFIELCPGVTIRIR